MFSLCARQRRAYDPSSNRLGPKRQQRAIGLSAFSFAVWQPECHAKVSICAQRFAEWRHGCVFGLSRTGDAGLPQAPRRYGRQQVARGAINLPTGGASKPWQGASAGEEPVYGFGGKRSIVAQIKVLEITGWQSGGG